MCARTFLCSSGRCWIISLIILYSICMSLPYCIHCSSSSSRIICWRKWTRTSCCNLFPRCTSSCPFTKWITCFSKSITFCCKCHCWFSSIRIIVLICWMTSCWTACISISVICHRKFSSIYCIKIQRSRCALIIFRCYRYSFIYNCIIPIRRRST